MIHTRFQDHIPFGSAEEEFLGFYYIWTWRPSWSCHCDVDRLNKLSFPHPMEWRLHMKVGFNRQVVSEKMFEKVDIHTHIHTNDRSLPIL